MENETTETSTSGCGSLILGMGALSRLIGDPKYESAALCALRELWGMWSSLNLLGTTLDISTGEWIVYSSGIGAGDDYLFKGHILLEMSSGGCFILLCRNISDMVHGPWYIEVGESILNSLNLYTKVERGFANIRDVTTMQLEDHQHSFFLAETPESKRDVCASMSSYNNEFVGMWRRTS